MNDLAMFNINVRGAQYTKTRAVLVLTKYHKLHGPLKSADFYNQNRRVGEQSPVF
jgi:hypothetical protein